MLKKILFTIFFIFVMIAPISANFPVTAYQVPWSQSSVYVIANVNGTLHALVSTNTATRIVRNFDQFFIRDGGHSLYRFINNQWTLTGTGDGFAWSSMNLAGIVYVTPTRSGFVMNSTNLVANSQDIVNPQGGQLFLRAPFQLPVLPEPEPEPTPEQVREGAVQEALNQLIHRISTDLSIVLPVGLLVLSLLLVIPLLKLWRGFLRL